MWCITFEITEQMTRKFKLREFLSRYVQQLVETMEFGNGQQYNNTLQTSRASQIRLVDKSIDALK